MSIQSSWLHCESLPCISFTRECEQTCVFIQELVSCGSCRVYVIIYLHLELCSYSCFIPLTKNKLHTKVFSYSSTPKEERVTLSETVELPLEEINGFVTVVHNDEWWIGCVLLTDEDSKTVTMNFLCPQRPSHSFKYPPKQNIITISYTDVLTKVDPRTVTGHTYTITKQESKAATENCGRNIICNYIATTWLYKHLQFNS